MSPRSTPSVRRFLTSALALGVFAALPFSATGEVVIQALAATLGSQKVESVPLLRSDAKIQSRQQADGLHLQLPAQAPDKYAYVFRILAAQRIRTQSASEMGVK